MSYFVYVLYSKSLDKFYKGQTSDMDERLNRHNQKRDVFTSNGVPWVLLWKVAKETRKEALDLEAKLKNLSRKKLILFIQKFSSGITGKDDFSYICSFKRK